MPNFIVPEPSVYHCSHMYCAYVCKQRFFVIATYIMTVKPVLKLLAPALYRVRIDAGLGTERAEHLPLSLNTVALLSVIICARIVLVE